MTIRSVMKAILRWLKGSLSAAPPPRPSTSGHPCQSVGVSGQRPRTPRPARPVIISQGARSQPLRAPDAPVLLGVPGDDQALLSYTTPAQGASAITTYIVYRDGLPINFAGPSTYIDGSAQNGTSYNYQVSAFNDTVGEGPKSNVAVVIPKGAPDAPVLSGIPGNNVVNLSWTTPNNNGSPITVYGIFRDGQPLATLGVVNSYADVSAVNGTSYDYAVLAQNAEGAGPLSNTVTLAPFGSGSSGLPADITNTLGSYKVVQWNDCLFEGNAKMATWKTRGFWGYCVKMAQPNGGVGFPAGGNRFKPSPSVNANNPYATQFYIESGMNPGSVGTTGWMGNHFPFNTSPFNWQYDGVPPAGSPQTVGKNHAVQYMQETAQFMNWQSQGFVGLTNDPEQVVGTQFYVNADSTQISPYFAAGTSPAAALARVMQWWYDISRAVHAAWPNAKMVAYQWVPKHGYEWDNVYNSIPKTVQPYYEYWVKHGMWVAWAKGMADTPNLGPNAQLICGNAWFYKNFSSGQAKNHTQGAIAEFSNSQHVTAGVNDFTDAQWSKIADKVKFSTFIWPFTDMSVTAPATVSVNASTNEFTRTSGTMFLHGNLRKRWAVVLNAPTFGLDTDRDYWLTTTSDNDHFTLHEDENGPVADITASGTTTVQTFRFHTSYYHTGEPAFATQSMAARKYSMGEYRFFYGHSGGEEAGLYDRVLSGQALTTATWTDVWRATNGAAAQDDAHNWYLIDPPNDPTWGAVPGGHMPGMRAAAAINTAGVFNPTDFVDTTAPTIRNATGALNLVTKTNLGGNSWQLTGRAAHALGISRVVAFNATTNPGLTGTPTAARLVWNKAGGSTSDVFPNAYQEFTINLSASAGNRIFVCAYSIHDQTHWVELFL